MGVKCLLAHSLLSYHTDSPSDNAAALAEAIQESLVQIWPLVHRAVASTPVGRRENADQLLLDHKMGERRG